PGKSRESTQSAGLFTALSVWTVARKRQLAAWRGGFMQQRQSAGLFTALSVWTVARKRQLAAWRGGFMQQRPTTPNSSA
ncbi:hypothetical protein, partial [Ralstonia pseudosolanacearum]|uniref:hypothetical protein n=1 Tax=Ralstonia pseudosolanacearum TaxID=1310165 RepID=UPI001E315EFA